jgi:Gas vesicle synthesis protein GvpL/GvpF
VYVYGLVSTGTDLPEGLTGLGPTGRVWMVEHRDVAAVVGDVPEDRPLGTRDDLLAHERVVDGVAAVAPILPMRFPAVVEERGVTEELLEPHHDRFTADLAELEGRVQFTLKGRYVEDAVVREVVEGDEEIGALRERVRELPEDASYYDRVRLGELVVAALEERREQESAQLLARLEPFAVATVPHTPANPDELVDAAFLVERARQREFEDAVEDLGRDLDGRVKMRLLGPLAPYDFVTAEG